MLKTSKERAIASGALCIILINYSIPIGANGNHDTGINIFYTLTMADMGRSATQRSPSRRSHTPDENANSLPTPTASSQKSASKPKQLPTVTPRRFKRFFTPRSSLKRNVKVGASRQVLRDITAGDSNRRSVGRRQLFSKDAIQIFEDQNENFSNASKKRKRGIPVSPDTTPDNSSPLKRVRGLTPPTEASHDAEFETDIDGGISDGRPSQDETAWDDEPEVKPIVRWREDGLPGHRLRHECAGDIRDTRRRIHAVCGRGKSEIARAAGIGGLHIVFINAD